MKLGQFILICLSLTAFFTPQKSEGQSISGTVNSYFKITHYIPSYNALRVQNISGLTTGDRVLIIQMKGATINTTTNSSSFGNLTNAPTLGGAGMYEFATICGLLNDTIVFEREFINTYDFDESVQMVHVPVYTNVTINGTLTAAPWDASTGLGGVIAIEATGTITLNADINANGTGYSGGSLLEFPNCSFFTTSSLFAYSLPAVLNNNANGAYKGEGINTTIAALEGGKGKQANGGGGGNNHNTGGGGGSNFGTGGGGGNYIGTGSFPCNGTNTGIGGLSLSTYGYSISTNRVFMGGGGGSGHANNPEGTPGGNGGGIVFIKCAELIGNNRTISANGSQGINSALVPNPINESRGDGGGGGGGGGTVLLNVATYTTSLNLSAIGANGNDAGFQVQCPGPGGGGGGGVIWASSVLPGTVATNVSGGANGIVKMSATHDPACEGLPNGATSGTNGTVANDFEIVEGDVFNCTTVLSIESLKEWYGKRLNDGVQLNWKLEQTDFIQEIRLQKKNTDGVFITLNSYQQPAAGFYEYVDESNELSVVYRLQLQLKNGKKLYSNQLLFDRQKVKRLNVYPNPVTDQLRIELPGSAKGKTMLKIFDYSGKLVLQQQLFQSNQSFINLNVEQLPAGTYVIHLYLKDELYAAKLVKK
ncbi:MAG: T9SS type A sorting domain-containing protein [Lacibacter sp.]|nr:T9SS type A sorting domain-containing protein [Lacibacter sp.]